VGFIEKLFSASIAVAGFLLAASVCAQVSVTTYHNDPARTGQNVQETLLTPENVMATTFGKLYTVPVDGYVFAEPLYLPGVNIGGGTHNVLYVVTGHDSVYALDADTGALYAQVSLIPSGGRTVLPADIAVDCTDQVPEIGITGTPVIDPVSGTLYVVAKAIVAGHAYQYLHALDTGTLAEKFGGPVNIQASVPGTGENSKNGVVPFNVLQENQRPALLLENGHVILTFGSHCDLDPWHGWVMSYGAATLAQEAVFNTTPNGSEAGIWMSGGGPAADTAGDIFFSTGNGTWDGSTDFGDSILKLGGPSGGTFAVLDYFTPFNQASLEINDNDVASGGVVPLPSLPSGQQLLGLVGKVGTLFVLDRNNLGKYCPLLTPACTTSDPQIVAEIPNATSGTWGSPAYWNGNLYWGGANSALKAYAFNTQTGGVSATPTSQSYTVFGYPSPSPSISANGNSAGVVWALDDSQYNSICTNGANCQILYAYDAGNLAHLLYNSGQAAGNRDVPGSAVKFATPAVANGKVYVGSQYAVSAFGQIASPPVPGIAVSLAAVGNRYGLATAGTPVKGGIDGHGQAFAANLLGTSLPWAGSDFSFSAAGPTSAVTSTTIPLNVGNATTLSLLATAVNGNQINQSFVVTYSDGTTTSFVQSLSDWSTPQHYAGEAIAFTSNYRIQSTGVTQSGLFNLYGYAFTLNAAKTPVSIALPKNANVVVFALDATPASGAPPAATPSFSPAGGTYLGAQTVSLASATGGAAIHYTLDGSTPTTSSTAYTGPLTVSTNTTINAIAIATGYVSSAVATAAYTITPPAAAPTFSPAAGTYTAAQTVSIASATAGASIYYTTNGTTPTTGSTPYTGAITVSATTTINAIAIAAGLVASPVAGAAYTITTEPVGLASLGNVYALGTLGTPVTGGGADGHGEAVAAAVLGSSVSANGTTFALTASGPGSGISNATVPLPVQSAGTLSLLGFAVNGTQANQSFTVTYTDGTSTKFTQSLSDWAAKTTQTGETLAATMGYRVKAGGTKESGAYKLYAYAFSINAAKTLQSLTLPKNANVIVLALDLGP
jgi:hypothetical protein